MKSFAKINIFLKITGKKDNLHTLNSRFLLLDTIYDEIEFIDGSFDKFTIFCDKEIKGKNIIEKSYEILSLNGYKNELKEFFSKKAVIITKNIPMGGGLGGGSSNAATFLKMLNKEIKIKNLSKLASEIGSDVSFFLSDFKSANVTSTGEIIEEFSDEIPNLEIIKNNISCDTTKVYKEFSQNFKKCINLEFSNKLTNLKSSEILASFKNYELNDLLKPCVKIYPNLKIKDDEFLSGSGSSTFKVKI